MLKRLRARNEWLLLAALPRAGVATATAWWALLVLRGVLPAAFGVGMGVLVAAVEGGGSLGPALALVGTLFVALQVLAPIHKAVSANLGDRTGSWLNDRLVDACVNPPGLAHLENPALTADLSVARDFDLGIMGPPLSIAMDFVAGGLVELFGGIASAAILAAYHWWASALLAGAWLSTHWLLRESAVWYDRNTPAVRAAQREADYVYRVAVEPGASKELRLFGLEDWTLGRFTRLRRELYTRQHAATRLREQPLGWSILLVTAANVIILWLIAADLTAGALSLARAVVFVQSVIGTSLIGFGGLNWALDGAAAPVGAVHRLRAAMAAAGELAPGAGAAAGLPRREVRFRGVTFAYPGSPPILRDLDLTIPAGSSLAIVGLNGAGKTTIAKLLCRFYDPQSGAIEVDGLDLRALDVASWRSRVTAVFQDFARFEWTLRDNVAPGGAPDTIVQEALDAAGARGLASLDTVLSRGYEGGTDLSGGQWQRVALARALAAVRLGAGLVLLDEPTAQLDVRGEAEIFDRILTATRQCTTVLISHRFSTVRHADRICVLEDGRVVELGSHAELMALDGRYRRMFNLQARRFQQSSDEEGRAYDVLS